MVEIKSHGLGQDTLLRSKDKVKANVKGRGQ